MTACVHLWRCCTPGGTYELRSVSSGDDVTPKPQSENFIGEDVAVSAQAEGLGHDKGWWALGDGSSSDNEERPEKGNGPPPVTRRNSTRGDLSMGRTRSLENGRLLDAYTLGSIIGQGSFGIVFACRKKGQDADKRGEQQDGHDMAVKLVDKVESLPEDIVREVQTQQRMQHPNILRVREVIDEKCFLCIITDRYWGGDLVKCIKSHVASGKRIRVGRIRHIVVQMLNAIGYLHELWIVHRDIKADNYLLDRISLMDSKCHVVLADFGFACECRLGDRLRRRCGTKTYWPPELWDRNYTQKVDMWAMGVTLFCIVEGEFPFKSEWEVKHKPVKCHPLLAAKCGDLIQQLLQKNEAVRPKATESLAHAWLDVQEGGGENDIGFSSYNMVDLDGPSPEVAARRMELVERLEGVHKRYTTTGIASTGSEGSAKRSSKMNWNTESSLDSAQATPLTSLMNPTFHVIDKIADKIRTFEWKNKGWVQNAGLDSVNAAEGGGMARTLSAESRKFSNALAVEQMLEAHGIDTSAFGQGSAKAIERFSEELENGASQLMMDAAKHKALVRVVDVVLLRLSCRSEAGVSHYLIVSADEQLDGRIRSDLNRLPGTKKRPHENVKNAAERIVMETPEIDADEVIYDAGAIVEEFEEDEESPSYPGVRTVYRKQVVAASLEREATERVFRGMAQQKNDSSRRRHSNARSTKFFAWLTETECNAKQVKLWAPKLGAEPSSLVPAPIGLKVKALGRFLQAHHIDPSAFGKERTKTLQELSTELITGESSLMSLPAGDVVRIVDVVLLQLKVTMQAHGSGVEHLLVVTKETSASSAGSESQVNRLPGTKRRPDENHFHAAKRILQRQLKVPENFINLDAENVQVWEEEKDSPSYPGLRTVYCKRIIKAELQAGGKGLTGMRSYRSSSATGSVPSEGRPQITHAPVSRGASLQQR